MKIHGFNKHLYMEQDDDGSGSGGGSPPPPPPPDGDEMVSKKETDKHVAGERRKHERAQKAMQKKLDDQAAEIEKLKAKTAPPPPPPPPTPPLPPLPPGDSPGGQVDGKLEIMEQRFNRQIDDLQGQVSAANQVANDERELRLQLERSQLIDKALVEAGVISKHLTQARRFFDPQVVMDELEERWMFKTTSGNIVEIGEGIAFEMPDNLKSTKMRGGAGTTGGIPNKKKVAQTLLDAAKKKMTDLSAAMKKEGPKNALLAQFTRAKNEVKRLESELVVRN